MHLRCLLVFHLAFYLLFFFINLEKPIEITVINSENSELCKSLFTNYLPNSFIVTIQNPQQIKKITIIEVKENETTTEETLTFMTILKKEITQTSIHRKKSNTVTTEIISGPFKNSKVIVNFEKNNDGVKVEIKANLAIPMKYKIFGLVIKKVYKNYLTSILYKMVNQIQ